MRRQTDSTATLAVEVSLSGEVTSAAAEYARRKIGALGRFTRDPVLNTRVRLTAHRDPAVTRPVVAQANIDVNGRLVRGQAQGSTPQEAVDRLVPRLRRILQRGAEHWQPRRGAVPDGRVDEWRHSASSETRPEYFPRPVDERRIVRRKSYAMEPLTVGDAALDMDLLDYSFYLFVEKGTGMASVLYRAGSTGYRLAQVVPTSAQQLEPFAVPLTLSAARAPCVTVEKATERLELLGLPFMFFIDAAQGRASVLYHRYDGHYGLLTPGG